MDRYHEMSVFLAVAEALSLTAAARTLKLSAPTVARAMDALEQRIGVTLLERSTRGVRLSTAGERFALYCQRLLADVAMADASAFGLHAEPRGVLTLSAPLLFGPHFLMPIILDYLDAHAAVRIDARFTDRFLSLPEENVDVAVLVGDLPDSAFFALRAIIR